MGTLAAVVWPVVMLVLLYPIDAGAQEQVWVGDGMVGYAGFVDDATKNYWVMGGSVRRYLTPRVSLGPEVVVMGNSRLATDRHAIATANVVFDLYRRSARRLTPFLAGGFGVFFSRDQVRNGPYWSTDPAFTAGGGVRARVGERFSIGGEYRLGWEPHRRLTATTGFHW